MQRRRVSEEVIRYVKLYQQDDMTPAKYVPAAAVIRMEQALSGFTGCKGSVGGITSQVKAGAQPRDCLKLWSWSAGEDNGIPCVAVKCVDIRRNTSG